MGVEISIIVCTHNRYDVLDAAILAIEAQDLPREAFELILVDNSTDATAQQSYLSRLDLLCEHQILIEAQPGLSRARNIGARAARAPIVAYVDDDAEPRPNWAAEMLAAFARHPKAGVIGGPVRPIWPAPRPPWLHPWLEGFLTILDLGEAERELQGREWLAGTNIGFRREALIAAGMFDERLGRIGRYLLSNEEVLVTRRMVAMGFSAIYAPSVEMRHTVHRERLTPSWFRRRAFWQTVSDFYLEDDKTAFTDNVETLLALGDRLPARERGFAGLFKDVDDPDVFYAEIQAIGALARLMANDGRDLRDFLRG